MLSILFSLHSRWVEFLVCCACVAYKEARGKSHSTYYIFILKRCSGWAFPHKGTHLLQTFTVLIVLLLRCLDQQHQSWHKRRLLFISFFWGVPSLLLSTCLCHPYKISCMSVPVVVSRTSPLQLHLVSLWAWAMFKLVFCINLGIYSHSTQQI